MEERNPNIPLRQSRPSHATLPHPVPTSFPIACLEDHPLEKRYTHAKDIEKYIQKFQPDFRIRVEHFAAILLVPLQDFDKGGLFELKRAPQRIKARLDTIPPFCKHYMLHLNPSNRLDARWAHAKPEPVTKQPPLNDEMSYDEIILSMKYRSSFKTCLASESPPTAEEEEVKCKKRDQNKCVLTGKPYNTSVFWFIPRGWNDTVQHNNATGNLQSGSMRLAKVPLLRDIHSATQLRQTQKAWNMLCVDNDVYDLLVRGLCAFKFIGKEKLDGRFKVQLKFFWMPDLPGRFNQIMDLNVIKRCEPLNQPDGHTDFNYAKVRRENIRELSVDLHVFQRSGCPQSPSDRYKPSANPNSSLKLMSGKDVYIEMSERDSELFESVVKIHWACVTFTALCGGAGRAWFMTGKNQVNGSLQPRDAEFKEEQRRRTQTAPVWRP
ncbi:hypothetical protein HYE68_007435 [Fusarium pseudograminearum]|nr:hypothetical protein HYE68_007435 [Fusarium pseudograminearum]